MPKNHLGEQTYSHYRNWQKACRNVTMDAVFQGNPDICESVTPDGITIGHWDGDEGYIYKRKGFHVSILNAIANLTPHVDVEQYLQYLGQKADTRQAMGSYEEATDYRQMISIIKEINRTLKS